MTNGPDNCFMAPHHHLMERCGHCTYEWDPPVTPKSPEYRHNGACGVGGDCLHPDHAAENDFPCCAPTGFEERTLTASEVKVLTETATRVAYALGRKDALEEVEARLTEAGARGRFARQLIQHAVSQAPGATSDATSGVPGHQEVSEAARSPQEPCGHPTCPCAEGNTP